MLRCGSRSPGASGRQQRREHYNAEVSARQESVSPRYRSRTLWPAEPLIASVRLCLAQCPLEQCRPVHFRARPKVAAWYRKPARLLVGHQPRAIGST